MCPPHSHVQNGTCVCDDGWSGKDLWDDFSPLCQVNELARTIINALSVALPCCLIIFCAYTWWTVSRKAQSAVLHSARSNINLLRFAVVFSSFAIAYSVSQLLGVRHSDRRSWFFFLYQVASTALLSQFIMGAYIWTRTFLRTHGPVAFLWCSLSKSTNALLMFLWLGQLALTGICFWDSAQYRLLAEISVSISWSLTVVVVASVVVSVVNVERALRQLGVQEPKIIGRAFYRIRLSWSFMLLVGAPTLVILPCFVFRVKPLDEYMYICFNLVQSNASLATGLILMEFRSEPEARDTNTAAEQSLLDSTSEAGSTVMISEAGVQNPRSKSTPWKDRIDQEF